MLSLVLYQRAEQNETHCTPENNQRQKNVVENSIVARFFWFRTVVFNYVHTYNIEKITGFVNPIIEIKIFQIF